jgi:lipoprotein-anchoring transpeptidase ErfK/SrfK
MKALCMLIVLSLLTGCSVLNLYPPLNAEASQAKVVAAVDKTNADKAKVAAPAVSVPAPVTPPIAVDKTNADKPKVAAPAVSVPAPTSQPFSATKILKVGAKGEDVLTMKKRLSDLYYDVGMVDDNYDQQTRQGVLAFQKYSQLARTGTYTLETQKALYEATLPVGLYPELGLPRVEIDITRQVLLFFDDQGLNRVVPVSTGSNRQYCEISKKSGKQVCGVARTPRGQFNVQWRVAGWRESDLGKLYNPLYFNGGFAIHGSPSVPERNVSHGCVRIPITTAIWFYKAVPNGTPVVLFD